MSNDSKKPDSQPNVLIIEHDPELCKVMEVSLEQAGVKVASVNKFTNALQILHQASPNVFVVDFDLRDGDPGKLITAFRQSANFSDGTVVISTSTRLEDDWRREYKPDSVIYKPFDIRYLIRLIGEFTGKKQKQEVEPA